MKKLVLATLGLVTVLAVAACNKSDSGGGGSSDNSGTTATSTTSTQYASTPQPCNGATGVSCTTQTTSYCPIGQNCSYGTNGYTWQFPTQSYPYNPGVGSCGCNSGYFPVSYNYSTPGYYNGYACAPFAGYASYTIVYYGTPSYNGYNGYNGYSNPGYGGWYNGYYQPSYNNTFTWYGYWNTSQNQRWLNNYQANYGATYVNSCLTSTAQGCDVRINNCVGGGRCQPIGGGSTLGLCVR